MGQWHKSLHAGKITAMEQPNAKQLLRRELIANRPQSSAGLLEQLKSVVVASGAKTIASYQALDSEPDTTEFNAWAELGHEVYYPLIKGADLVFAKSPLVEGKFGIKEPTGPQQQLSEIDLVFVPALAVDMEGHRLGKGKGFYDRALKDANNKNLYAVVFESEIILEVPSEAHDKKVTGIVTPARVIELSAR